MGISLEKNGYVVREQLLYALYKWKAGHDSGFWSGISVRSRGNKGQSGLSYYLHYRETCAPASSEHVQSTTFALLIEASLFKLTGWFHIHFFLFI